MSLKSLSKLLLIPALLAFHSAIAQQAYQIIDVKGKKVNFNSMVEDINKADVIFFGEIHNQPVSHWLNLEIIKAIYAKDSALIIGMEMFEKDQQRALDEMSSGLFTAKKLSQYTRTWNNFDTDYLPIIQYCQDHGVAVKATNIPRQYASFVFSHGLDSLYELNIPDHLLPPNDLPIDTNLVSYSEILDMASQMGHGGGFFLEAQAIKDMMMAQSIHDAIEQQIKFIHTNGVFHTKYKEGIAWYLKQMSPDLDIIVISCQEWDNFETFQAGDKDQTDYHILIDQDITKSYE